MPGFNLHSTPLLSIDMSRNHYCTSCNFFKPQFRSRDVGKHLLGVDDLLEKQELLEAQLNSQGELLKNVSSQALTYVRSKGEQYEVLQRKLDNVAELYERFIFLGV